MLKRVNRQREEMQMVTQSYDLKYILNPGAMACYHGMGETAVVSNLPEAQGRPDQAMEISLMLKTLYQDRGERFHLYVSSVPIKSLVEGRETALPHLRSIYAMVDRRGIILEATDSVILLIHPFPAEPVPLGYMWDREEYLQPADPAEPLHTTTFYTLEKECDIEGAPHLQIAFRTPGVSYAGRSLSGEKRTITYRRDGFFLFDPSLGLISRVDQTSQFYTEQKDGFIETTYHCTVDLGEILEDTSMLPKIS
jgi:hypothetical protein